MQKKLSPRKWLPASKSSRRRIGSWTVILTDSWGWREKLQFEVCQEGQSIENISGFELGLQPQSKGESEIDKFQLCLGVLGLTVHLPWQFARRKCKSHSMYNFSYITSSTQSNIANPWRNLNANWMCDNIKKLPLVLCKNSRHKLKRHIFFWMKCYALDLL